MAGNLASRGADPLVGNEPVEPTRAEDEPLLRTQDVVRVLGLSRRQLQYWAKTGLIVPSARTAGGHHRYTFADLVALKATKRLIDEGVSVQRIRTSLAALSQRLPSVQRPLEELVIVATGDVLVVFDRDTVFEAWSGQEWVFEVAQFRRELDAWKQHHSKPTGPVRRARPVRRGAAQERNVG